MLITTGVTKSFKDMTFLLDYAGSKSTEKVMYIEYQDGIPHAVITLGDNEYLHHFYFERDCNDDEGLMCYLAGGGGDIRAISPPQYTEEYTGASYWMHPDASYIGMPYNIIKLLVPFSFNGDPNPFRYAREIDGVEYCKMCEKMYDNECCPYHHIYNEERQRLEYHDGTSAEE